MKNMSRIFCNKVDKKEGRLCVCQQLRQRQRITFDQLATRHCEMPRRTAKNPIRPGAQRGPNCQTAINPSAPKPITVSFLWHCSVFMSNLCSSICGNYIYSRRPLARSRWVRHHSNNCSKKIIFLKYFRVFVFKSITCHTRYFIFVLLT